MVTRRNLLAGTTIGAGVVLTARAAGALTMQDVPAGSSAGLAFGNRCGGPAEHAQIVSSLRAQLAADGASPGTAATATCPICGCPVTVTAGG